jgi:hypothetical protein
MTIFVTLGSDTLVPLTDTAIRNAKAKGRPFKLSDKKGRYRLFE